MSSSKTDIKRIVSINVHATNYKHATDQIIDWALNSKSKFVCAANVHVTMEAYDNEEYQKIIDDADMVTPDGMPLVWALRFLGVPDATRVYGPDLTLYVCEESANKNIPIGLYGASEDVLNEFNNFLKKKYPNINIVCKISPPFRKLTEQENDKYVRQISDSGAKILLVGLGCPKQEIWIHNNVNKISAVMLGVGAAFDFHAGNVKQAPRWMMNIGMEWFFRLIVEPQRLWKRYLWNNPRFIWLLAIQLMGRKYQR